jgi:hypothetical protein
MDIIGYKKYFFKVNTEEKLAKANKASWINSWNGPKKTKQPAKKDKTEVFKIKLFQ